MTTTTNTNTDAEVQLSTPDQTNADNSADTPQFVQVPAEVYASYMRDIREAQVAKKIKVMGVDYTNRRNTLIIRKATRLFPNIVRDEEVVAYYDLYKMREALQGEGKKVLVSEEETEAYIELWAGANTPSLEAVENHIAKKSI